MADDRIVSERMMPVLIGENYEHVMGNAVIYEEPGHVEISITITADGDDARTLAGFITTPVPIALCFRPVPVQVPNKERK